jgi:large subunit ribosomal protein L9
MNKKVTKSIQLILLKTVFGLGKEGSEVKVKPGYARFLLTEDKALLLNPENKELFLGLQLNNQARKEKEKNENISLIENLRHKKELDLYVMAGESKKIFGRITRNKIKEELFNIHNLIVPADSIILQETMKVLGSYSILISFASHEQKDDVLTTPFIVHIKDKNQLEEERKAAQ